MEAVWILARKISYRARKIKSSKCCEFWTVYLYWFIYEIFIDLLAASCYRFLRFNFQTFVIVGLIMFGFILGSFDTFSIANFLYIEFPFSEMTSCAIFVTWEEIINRMTLWYNRFSRKLNGCRWMKSVTVPILVTVNFHLTLRMLNLSVFGSPEK